MTPEDIRFLREHVPAATEEELYALDDVVGLTPSALYLDGYHLSDLIDALRIGKKLATLESAPTETPEESDATRS